MRIRKKKDDEEDSFASKLSTLGSALSAGGENKAESTLESVGKIVEGVASLKNTFADRADKNRSKMGLDLFDKEGNRISEQFENIYKTASEGIGTEAFKGSAADSDLFDNAVVKQLNLDDPKQAVMGKAFTVNKETLNQLEGSSFTKMMKMDPEELKKLMMPWGMGR